MTIIKSNRPVYAAAAALEGQDVKDTKARVALFMTMRDAGANEETLCAKGELYADLLEGVMFGWQGAAFVKSFGKDTDGAREITGKILNAHTGKVESVTKTRKEWQQALGSKVTKARKAYLMWQTGPVNAGTKPGQGSARDINMRVTEELGKLFKAVTADLDSDSPALKANHRAMRAAFNLALAMINRPMTEAATKELISTLLRASDIIVPAAPVAKKAAPAKGK